MHALVKLFLAWLVATAAAVTLGVVAVGVVSDSVTEDRPERLSAIAVRNALQGPGTSPVPGATDPTATTAPAAGAPAPEDRTYQLVGGTVGVRFENGGARLLWATPKPGFRVESSGSSGHVDARFRSEEHESRLRAFWDGGPQSDVEERDG